MHISIKKFCNKLVRVMKLCPHIDNLMIFLLIRKYTDSFLFNEISNVSLLKMY